MKILVDSRPALNHPSLNNSGAPTASAVHVLGDHRTLAKSDLGIFHELSEGT